VVDGGVDASVTNRLGHDALGVVPRSRVVVHSRGVSDLVTWTILAVINAPVGVNA
jgi:hypothetical protein